MKNIFLAVIAVVGVVTPTVVLADDGSCGDFRKVTGTELIMCADLAKGPTSQQAHRDWKCTWFAEGRDGTCLMNVEAQGIIGGSSHSVQATCTVTNPEALRACIAKAKYATDVAQCGMQYLKK
jgi:hypothetical protein